MYNGNWFAGYFWSGVYWQYDVPDAPAPPEAVTGLVPMACRIGLGL